MGTDVVGGEYPVPVSACTTAPRQSGALLELAATNATRPQPELPDYLPVSDAESLASQYPEGADADRAAALECFQQWSACRFEIGSSELPLQDRYTGGFYALRSDGDLLRTIPEGEGRTAESLVRQARPDPGFIIGGPYPDEVLDVRIYPPDDRGQARLLVLHRTVSGIGVQQFSLLVLEKDSWRLAERIEPADVPVSATSGSAPDPSQAVISLNLDVGNPDDDRRFLDLAPSDRPIAVSITNSGSTSSIGDTRWTGSRRDRAGRDSRGHSVHDSDVRARRQQRRLSTHRVVH